MWRRPTSRARDVLMGLLIGLGVVGVLVRWNDGDAYDCDKKMSVRRYNDGERSFMHLAMALTWAMIIRLPSVLYSVAKQSYSLGCSSR